jgi:hypothetical protein
MGYLIEKEKEKQWVNSLEGYEGWQVVVQDVPRPIEDSTLDLHTKTWKVDKEKRRESKHKAISNTLDNEQLIFRLEDLLADIEDRLEALEIKEDVNAAGTRVMRQPQRKYKIIKDEELNKA